MNRTYTNQHFEDYLARKQREWGSEFDDRGLDPRFIPYYHTGTRIKVETCGMVLTGTVGATTGWRPCFLLMRTSRSIGSPWTLGKTDKILAVQSPRTKKYNPV